MNTTVRFENVKLVVPASHSHQSLKSFLIKRGRETKHDKTILDVPHFEAKVGDKMIDQQGAGCRGNPAQSEDGKVKAQLRSTHRLSSMLDRSAWQR